MDSWQRFSLHPSDDPVLKGLFDFRVATSLPGESGSFSEITVAREHTSDPGLKNGIIIMKSSSTSLEASMEPHDIARELKILSMLCHINVIEVLGSHVGKVNDCLHFWMPHIKYALANILDCPVFSPYPVSTDERSEVAAADFVDMARSLLFQIFSAVAYLHHPAQGVAHRDIKAANVLITESGCVKLIDFGVSWSQRISASSDCLWPEPPGQLCFDVSTGAYRAPELLFGARDYDPYATDLWSLGVLCAEFFAAVGARGSDSDLETDEEDNLYRASLFDATRGSIGLAWSIFRIRGTPTEEIWPAFTSLPDGSKVSFQEVPPIDLVPHLPNIPPGDHPAFTGFHLLPGPMTSSPVDLIYRLLVYPPEQRLRADDALRHPWFASQPLLMPDDYSGMTTSTRCQSSDRSLGDMLANVTTHRQDQDPYNDSEGGSDAEATEREEEETSV